MSDFSTRIPVDLDAVKKHLPLGATVMGVTWDGKDLVMKWHHQRLLTPYTFPVDFSLEQLRAHELPAGVKERPLPPPIAGAPTAERPMGDDPEAAKGRPKRQKAKLP